MRTFPKKQLFLGIVLLVVSVCLHLVFGSVSISFVDIVSGNLSDLDATIIKDLRWPKVLTSICIGAGLSAAGLLMQALFRNALAGPSILGVSSGASMGVALFVLGPATWWFANLDLLWGKVLSAFIGCLLVMSLVLLLTKKVKSNIAILIVGVMIGSIASSLVGFLQFISNAEDLQSFVLWTLGSTFIEDSSMLSVLMILTGFGVIALLLRKNGIKYLLLPQEQAQLLGLNIVSLKRYYIIVSCVLVGVITAFCGPIAFVGLMVPHAVRYLSKEDNPSLLLLPCLIFGAAIMVFSSWLASLPGSELSVPINIVTSMFGAPIVILLLLKSRWKNG
jgi:iron complex transport system permease protein